MLLPPNPSLWVFPTASTHISFSDGQSPTRPLHPQDSSAGKLPPPRNKLLSSVRRELVYQYPSSLMRREVG